MSYVRRNGDTYWRLLPQRWHVGTWTYQSLLSEPPQNPHLLWLHLGHRFLERWHGGPGFWSDTVGQTWATNVGISWNIPPQKNNFHLMGTFERSLGITTFQNQNRTNNCELQWRLCFKGACPLLPSTNFDPGIHRRLSRSLGRSLGRSFQGLVLRRRREASVWVEALLAGLSGANFKHGFFIWCWRIPRLDHDNHR